MNTTAMNTTEINCKLNALDESNTINKLKAPNIPNSTNALNALYLKKGEERRLAAGHLWIYNNEIDVGRHPLKNFHKGELVVIHTHRNQPLGIGYINPHTLLCARLLTRNHQEKIDLDFFVQRIKQALAWREKYLATQTQPSPASPASPGSLTPSASHSYRLVFGESDGLPGLVVDRCNDILVAQANTAGMDNLKDLIRDALLETLNPTAILWRNDSATRELEGLERYVAAAYGIVPQHIVFEEHGAKFAVPLWDGQKTGWFFDQSYNRERLRHYVKCCLGSPVQKGYATIDDSSTPNDDYSDENNTSAAPILRVLDVCSYIGACGIQVATAAATAGATSCQIICVDSSEAALAWAKRNAELNQVAGQFEFICDDAFSALKKLRAQNKFFDVIILDPPAFIKKRKDIKEGSNAYLRLHELALQLLTAPKSKQNLKEQDSTQQNLKLSTPQSARQKQKLGVLFTTSCSLHMSRDMLLDVIRQATLNVRAVREIKIVEQLHQAPDHPIHQAIMETNYLKGFCVIVTS